MQFMQWEWWKPLSPNPVDISPVAMATTSLCIRVGSEKHYTKSYSGSCNKPHQVDRWDLDYCARRTFTCFQKSKNNITCLLGRKTADRLWANTTFKSTESKPCFSTAVAFLVTQMNETTLYEVTRLRCASVGEQLWGISLNRIKLSTLVLAWQTSRLISASLASTSVWRFRLYLHLGIC